MIFNDATQRDNILIVDQVMGDASLTLGAKNISLEKRIAAAQEENPNAATYIKLHPETIHGFRQGLFSSYKKDKSVQFIRDDYNPFSVLEPMNKVYVATFQLGFEALLAGKEVVCFGMPFYAGWA